jgi:hypothetical protein
MLVIYGPGKNLLNHRFNGLLYLEGKNENDFTHNRIVSLNSKNIEFTSLLFEYSITN